METTNYNVLEKLTNHFYMVVLDSLDDTYGGDILLPTLDDCDEYAKYVSNIATENGDSYLVTFNEYVLTDDELNELEYDVQAFFDNMYDYNSEVVDSFIVGKKKNNI